MLDEERIQGPRNQKPERVTDKSELFLLSCGLLVDQRSICLLALLRSLEAWWRPFVPCQQVGHGKKTSSILLAKSHTDGPCELGTAD